MIGRRAVVGLSLLSALLFCAFAAQSASAAKSTTTTFFTCVENGGAKDFKNAHCDPGVDDKTGKLYGHVAIAPDSGTTELAVTNAGVTESTKKSENWVFKSKVAGAKTTITCTTIKTAEKEGKSLTNIHNVTSEVEGKKLHTATGETVIDYSGCTVSELAKCIVTEPIRFETTITAVDGLGAGKNEMGLEFVGKGPEESFATFQYTNKGAEKCAVDKKSFTLKGSMTATSGPETGSAQTNNSAGSTLVFTPTGGMQKVKLGPETAEVTTINTLTMFGANGKPISMTTVTT